MNCEKIFEHMLSDIYNEEVLCVQQIFTAHLLHRCTLQWKLNNTTADDHIANNLIITWDITENKDGLNSATAHSASALSAPASGSGQSSVSPLENFKKYLNVWLKAYILFEDDAKKLRTKNEIFVDFQCLLNNAYHLKREKINYIEFVDPNTQNREMNTNVESSQESDINPHEEPKIHYEKREVSEADLTVREYLSSFY
jgi:hypothetical protein